MPTPTPRITEPEITRDDRGERITSVHFAFGQHHFVQVGRWQCHWRLARQCLAPPTFALADKLPVAWHHPPPRHPR